MDEWLNRSEETYSTAILILSYSSYVFSVIIFMKPLATDIATRHCGMKTKQARYDLAFERKYENTNNYGEAFDS